METSMAKAENMCIKPINKPQHENKMLGSEMHLTKFYSFIMPKIAESLKMENCQSDYLLS